MLPIILAIVMVAIVTLTATSIPIVYDIHTRKENKIVGNLIVVFDPEDGPYMFLEMHKDINYILNQGTATLKIVDGNSRTNCTFSNGNDVDSKEVNDD